MKITWTRRAGEGYEVSSIGDKRFSAFYATLSDGRSIEQWYQCDERSPNGYPLKGYDPGGRNWKLGKGRSPKDRGVPRHQLWLGYLDLWETWAKEHPDLMAELYQHACQHEYALRDTFAVTSVNQAHALSLILSEQFG